MADETFASNQAEVRLQLSRYLRREIKAMVVVAVVLLVIFAPLGFFLWRWLWLGLLFVPVLWWVMFHGTRRLHWSGDVRPAQVLSLDPPRLAIFTDLTMRPDASHPAIVVKETSLKKLTGKPVRVGDRLAVTAFYMPGDEAMPQERWKGLSVVEPVRGATGDVEAIRRTFESISKNEWESLKAGILNLQAPYEEQVVFLEEGRKAGGKGVTEGRVFLVPPDDPVMKKAEDFGRKTIRFFLRELSWEKRRIVPGLDIAAVKIAFSDPPEIRSQNPADLEVEYMWISEVEFDGRKISGVLLNEPDSLKSVSAGDTVSVSPKQIVDWLYSVMGEVCGGFTIQAMRRKMEKRELKKHDNAWGLDFGSPGVVRLVPDSYLPEAIQTKRVAIPDLEGMFIQGNFRILDSMEHPMSVNMRESMEESLGGDHQLLDSTDSAGLPLLHSMAVAGSLDGVDVCLNHGADPNLRASNGTTPAMLAKMLGWKKVLQRLEQAGAKN